MSTNKNKTTNTNTYKSRSNRNRNKNNYTIKNDTQYDNITDRFISTLHDSGNPGYYRSFVNNTNSLSVRSTDLEHTRVNENGNSLLNRSFNSPFILRHDNFLLRSTQFNDVTSPSNFDDDSYDFSNNSYSLNRDAMDIQDGDIAELESENKDVLIKHKGNVAKALGFKIRSRILNFKPLKFSTTRRKMITDLMEEKEEKEKEINDSIRKSNTINSNSISLKKVKTEVPFKVLDAPGLRNDFYANVVSCSKITSLIAVGLGGVVYTWCNEKGTVPLQSIDNEIISCVAFGPDNLLVAGTKTGRLIVYTKDSRQINTTAILKPSTGICCITWIKNAKIFFSGDDLGDVTIYELVQDNEGEEDEAETNYQLTIKCTFKCNEQQVCGIDVSPDGKQITVGGNDNCCTIWDISDMNKPTLKFVLPHQAAVKAISYCPWMPNLLASGGGSKDRNIRFWHTNSGTLINTVQTKAQITSLIWSKSSKELLVTFGFGDVTDKPILISVYAYPSMKLQTKLASTSNMRVLSAVCSNDSKSICTAISDQSVRIYSIWESNYDLVNAEYDGGLFGSELIGLEEGVDSSFELIR